MQGMKLGSIHWTDSLLEAPDYCQSVPRLSHQGRGVGSYKWDTLDRHYNVTGRPFLPQLYEALFSITLTFRVDDTDINMLELVSGARECSVVVVITNQLLGISGLSHVERVKAQQKVPSINIPKLSRLIRGTLEKKH